MHKNQDLGQDLVGITGGYSDYAAVLTSVQGNQVCGGQGWTEPKHPLVCIIEGARDRTVM